MTNITEADHDAVDWLYEMGVIAPHHLRLANEAFARHREQTERQSADRIKALEAENERLNGLILATADHWLALQCDHSVEWAGAIDTAMEAACDEIRRLSAALGEKQ